MYCLNSVANAVELSSVYTVVFNLVVAVCKPILTNDKLSESIDVVVPAKKSASVYLYNAHLDA